MIIERARELVRMWADVDTGAEALPISCQD